MTVKVEDLMADQVIVAGPGETCGEVRDWMQKYSVHAVPVVDEHKSPIGFVSSRDLVGSAAADQPVSDVMTPEVITVPRYANISAAATVMRKHRIHHVVVTDEKQVVGILSAFDLLTLVEGRRFVMKNAPTRSNRKRKQNRLDS